MTYRKRYVEKSAKKIIEKFTWEETAFAKIIISFKSRVETYH